MLILVCLFLIPEVTVATRSGPYPAQMITAVTRFSPVSRSDGGSAPRDNLYSSERQWRPGHLDEPRDRSPVRTSSTRQPSGKDHWNQWKPLQSDFAAVGTNYWFVWPEGNWPPQLSLVSPKVFSPFCHWWSFGSLPLSPLACLVGDTSFQRYHRLDCTDTFFKLNWAERWHHWIQ